jgi:hypothetical protein
LSVVRRLAVNLKLGKALGPPRARECQGYGRRLRLPRFGGAAYAVSLDDWSGYREVGFFKCMASMQPVR